MKQTNLNQFKGNSELFKKIHIPKGGVQTLRRKEEFIEVLKDWRFAQDSLSTTDIMNLNDKNLSRKLSSLVPHYQKYKIVKQEENTEKANVEKTFNHNKSYYNSRKVSTR